MTVFGSCFLFLNSPQGGVEDFAWLKANCSWIKGVFCNVRDYAPSEWEKVVRPRALSYGFFCGAWGRTTEPDEHDFIPAVVDLVIATTDKWQSPGIVNSEIELNNNQPALNYIVAKIGNRDIALSVQANPFDSIDWSVVGSIPILPQIFPAEAPGYDPIPTRDKWWSRGVKCVYMTFGTYGGMKPSDFDLVEPYSLFTGDIIMATHTAPLWKPTSDGWIACKPTTGGSMLLTPEQFPYTGPYGLSTGAFKSKGPTAEAVKRAMGHLGYMPWRDYDQHWNLPLWEAFADWKQSVGLAHDGSYGPKAWEKLRAATYIRDGKRKFALDPYCRYLVQNEAGKNSQSVQEDKVMAALSEWGYAIINNESRIGYSQDRPVQVNVDPNSSFDSDCSGTIIQGYAYAKRKTDLPVPDPAKMRFSGYGNTDWYEDDHPKVGGPYRVGDLAHFHSARHVVMCIKAGTTKTAEWVSHGMESGPDLIKLSTYSRFPGEFLFVVRPPLLEEDDL